MTLEKIEALLRMAANRGLAALDYAEGGTRLSVSFAAPGGPAAAEDAGIPLNGAAKPRPAAPSACIPAPGVGFFRACHPAGGTLPAEGEQVAAGTVVAFLQAGPVLQPVVAGSAGTLGARLVVEGAGVGFGTPLFALS